MQNRVNLTEERIKALKPEEGCELVLWDTEVRGFGVRCWPSGRKMFILLYRANGGGRKAPQRRMTLGEVGSVRLADARVPTAFKLDVPVAAPELPQAAAAPAQPKLVPVDHDPFAPPVAPATPGLGAQNAAREGRLYVTPEAPKPIERPV
ncbi:protein of unknown function [Bradyrhizobium sp. Rc2d]|uniref:Arm DNA-binding domain-containing protein n=1 Tax=Bradyrhizobium sp. Rc2d TaxID=1855321 RepID=UPI00088D4D5C|nr:Arm DNA-binding domain-containing protein [Bradyrhizobium sp. Rc2d]SDK12495.1 protein of unknown function [Bradyrhizobium sp. Rc2d]